ncbi:MAG: hypothetical protein HQL40_05365 [Alphaproteobacteria bacterium]|nr:hypothetical protein [Alphaproteobacteria bacterium]
MTQISNATDLYNHLLATGSKIVTNIPFPWSPGHMTHDIDNFLRMRRLGEIPERTTCLLIFQQFEIPFTMADMFARHFDPAATGNQFIINNQLYDMAREIVGFDPSLAIDPGLSHSKFAWADRSTARLSPFQNRLHWAVTNKVVLDSMLKWCQRRALTMDYQPFSEIPPITDPAFVDALGGDPSKVVLVQMKTEAANAGAPMKPENFFPVFSFLKDSGYRLVFGCRDPYPEEFKRFDVLNYAQSGFANFRNDMLMYKAAALAIVGASGIGSVAQMARTPLVNYNGWHLNAMFSSPAGVWVPALLRRKSDGRPMRFFDQLEILENRPEGWDLKPDKWSGPGGGNPWTFGQEMDELELRAAEGDELLAAAQEALSLVRDPTIPRTESQDRFANFHPRTGFRFLEGRVSRHFVEKFADLL